MVKEKPKTKISRKKIALLLIGLILLLSGGGAVFFRIKSHQEFERFVGKLEDLSQQETEILLGLIDLGEEGDSEFSAIVYDGGADVKKNRSHLAKAQEAYEEEYEKEKNEYLPLVEEKATEVEQFLTKSKRLWLWGGEKTFLELVSSVVEAARAATEADADLIEKQILIAKVSFAIMADSVEYFYFLGGINRIDVWGERLKPFKKYTVGYKFEGEGEIKALYPKVYTALTNHKALFAKVYETYTAYLEGKYAESYRLSVELEALSKRNLDIVVDWKPLQRSLYQAEVDAHAAGLSAVRFYKEKKLGKVSLGERRLATWAIAFGSHLYAFDHDEEYPEADEITDLVKALTEGEYLPSDFQFDQETFSCSFRKGKDWLSFTDEVTGEEITITLVD